MESIFGFILHNSLASFLDLRSPDVSPSVILGGESLHSLYILKNAVFLVIFDEIQPLSSHLNHDHDLWAIAPTIIRIVDIILTFINIIMIIMIMMIMPIQSTWSRWSWRSTWSWLSWKSTWSSSSTGKIESRSSIRKEDAADRVMVLLGSKNLLDFVRT